MKDVVIPPLAAALRVETTPAIQAELVGKDGPATPPAPEPSEPAPEPASPARTLQAETSRAAARQDGMVQLLADLTAAADTEDLPDAVRGAMKQLIGLQTVLKPSMTGTEIRTAMHQSGLFLEAAIAGRVPAQPDFKAALVILQSSLQALIRTRAPEPPGRPRGQSAPPPFRNGPLAAQAAVPPSPDFAPERLLRQTEAALARQDLLQLASLPENRVEAAPGATQHWMFELPLVTPQGPAVGQFEIHRDDRRGSHGVEERIWRVRFAIDIEPLGPVEAHVMMLSDRTQVTLWAERAEGMVRLEAHRTELLAALPGAEIAVYPGKPHQPPPAAGRLVDQSS